MKTNQRDVKSMDLKNEFTNSCHWGDITSLEEIADWWLDKLSKARQDTIQSLKEKILDIKIPQVQNSNVDIELGELRFRKEVLDLLYKDIEQ